MARLLQIVIALALLWLVFSVVRKVLARRRPESNERAVEDMVQCTHCGVHLPRNQALQNHEQYYCSAEHRSAGPPQ